jgi:type I restriction enzyme M protein
MIDRTQRELVDDDVAQIADTYHAWRGDKRSRKYEDIAGFCRSVPVSEIRAHDHVLTPGRYVGNAEEEADDEPFEVKFSRLSGLLRSQFAAAATLERQIIDNLSRTTNA